MKPNDSSILEAEVLEAYTEAGKNPEPVVSLIVSKSTHDYEIIITADELRAMLDECDPDDDTSIDFDTLT